MGTLDYSGIERFYIRQFKQEMPLDTVSFDGCHHLTDKAFEYLKGMPLKKNDFSYCSHLTDRAPEYLKGMPLQSVHFTY